MNLPQRRFSGYHLIYILKIKAKHEKGAYNLSLQQTSRELQKSESMFL